MSGQGLDTTAGTTAGTTAPASGTTRTGSAVGLVEASRIAALIGHGHVSKAEQESTATGVVYEVTVVQPDGTERTVTVDRTTGRGFWRTPWRTRPMATTPRTVRTPRTVPTLWTVPDAAGTVPTPPGTTRNRDHTDSRTGDEAHERSCLDHLRRRPTTVWPRRPAVSMRLTAIGRDLGRWPPWSARRAVVDGATTRAASRRGTLPGRACPVSHPLAALGQALSAILPVTQPLQEPVVPVPPGDAQP